MKNILTTFALCFSTVTQAQFSLINKQQAIGCFSNDVKTDHIIDKNGDIILVGYMGGYPASACSLASRASANSFDGWVAKIDSNWNVKWSKNFGGTKEDRLWKVIECQEGYITIGYTMSSDGDISASNKGIYDIWVLRLNSNGDKLWSKTFGSSSADNAYDIIETSDKGFIIVGSLGMNDGDAASTTIKGSNDAWIIKLDASGNMIWQKTYGTSKSDYASTITQISNNSYILCGRASAADGDLTMNNGSADMWVFKINNTGSLIWSKNFGGSKTEIANCVLKNSSGDLLIGAASNSYDYDVSGNYGDDDYWLIKLDTNGNKYWQKNYGGTNSDLLSSIVESKEGGYLLLGNSISNDNDATGLHGSLYPDILAVKINDTGKVEWHKMYGGSSGESEAKCYQLKDTSYVFVSITNSSDGDIKKSNGLADAWFVKLNRTAAADIASVNNSTQVSVFPTITNGVVNISSKYDNNFSVIITNAVGQVIIAPFDTEATKRIYNLTSYPKGMYFVSVFTKLSQTTYKVVLY